MSNLKWLKKLCPSFQHYAIIKNNKADPHVLTVNYNQGKLLSRKKKKDVEQAKRMILLKSLKLHIRICAHDVNKWTWIFPILSVMKNSGGGRWQHQKYIHYIKKYNQNTQI